MDYTIERIDTVIHKDNSIDILNSAFQNYIMKEDYKTANLLAYWINDFAKYHEEENKFLNKKLKVFKRGAIIKANLGFNIGNELRRITLLYCS